MMIHYDHIVIGVGSMGSATCYHLARRGRTVLGIEQFSIPHELGSHSGETRIIRKAYFEHPDYIPLLIRAYELWQELMERTAEKLFHRTGLFYAAPRGHELLENIKNAAAQYNITLNLSQVPQQFSLPSNYDSIFEPDAGFVTPENTIRALVKQAIESGAEIHEREEVRNWTVENDHIVVETNLEKYQCRKLIITAGAWAAKLIPGIAKNLRVTRQVLAWYKPAAPEQFSEQHFPCWLMATENIPGVYYGFPTIHTHPGALKLAYHYPGIETDAAAVNRSISSNDTKDLHDFIKNYIPQAEGELEQAKICLYSNSPDENFVIDNLPGMENRVCVAWGFSGHGFKFVPVVGEILADLAMYGKTNLPIDFLNAKRFDMLV